MIFLLNGFCRLLAILPRRMGYALGRGLGGFLHLVVRGKVKVACDALRQSFPEWPEQKVRDIARQVFINQGVFAVEFFRKIGRPRVDPIDEMRIDDEDAKRFHDALREHKSVIFLVSHINNYEYLAAWSARHYPVTIITKKIKPKSLGEFVMAARAANGLQEFPNRGSYRSVLRNLRAGGCVGFILDQHIPKEQGVYVTFFGRPASTSPGLAMMSAHAGAPVMPAYTVREGDYLRIKFMELIPPPPARDANTLQDFTQRYTSVLESIIRKHPESWIWIHKRWKAQPLPGDRVTLSDGTDYYA
jgi:KDO2-lipid IV(A) lauroyltransferase